MVNKTDIKTIISDKPEYAGLVYQRGFLITNSDTELNNIAFCNNWSPNCFGNYKIWLHPNTQFRYLVANSKCYFLIGNAIFPHNHLINECAILEVIAAQEDRSQQIIDELTGVFIFGVIAENRINFQADAVGMYASFWGVFNDKFFLASHPEIIADITKAPRDSYVDRLISHRLYKFFGAGLPGDMTAYVGIQRTEANHCFCYSSNMVNHSRIYPVKPQECLDYDSVIDEVSGILETTLTLAYEKWGQRAALGLTGGKDSKTSLAAAHNILDKLRTFTFLSCDGEKPDADAAVIISKTVGVSHELYEIKLNAEDELEVPDLASIIEYNMGNIGRLKDRDVRKRYWFLKNPQFDVEIKSWVDEIGRARYHKRYRINRFSTVIKPRYMTTMYKVFGANRALAIETDRRFSKYLNTYYEDVFNHIPWWDLLYWEYAWSASEALHLLCEHMLTYDVFVPFNNRRLLSLMLSVPLKKRINDDIQNDVIKSLLPEINDAGVSVLDAGWGTKREIIERVYWEINTRIPF